MFDIVGSQLSFENSMFIIDRSKEIIGWRLKDVELRWSDFGFRVQGWVPGFRFGFPVIGCTVSV